MPIAPLSLRMSSACMLQHYKLDMSATFPLLPAEVLRAANPPGITSGEVGLATAWPMPSVESLHPWV